MYSYFYIVVIPNLLWILVSLNPLLSTSLLKIASYFSNYAWFSLIRFCSHDFSLPFHFSSLFDFDYQTSLPITKIYFATNMRLHFLKCLHQFLFDRYTLTSSIGHPPFRLTNISPLSSFQCHLSYHISSIPFIYKKNTF